MKDSLRAAGLTLYETNIYLALLEWGRMDARLLAERSGVPPTAVYPTIKCLVHKGLVQQLDGSVRNYEALNPSVSLPAFFQGKRKDLTALETSLLDKAQRIIRRVPEAQREILNLSVGQHASVEIYNHALSSSQKSLYILGWRLHRVKDKYMYLQRFRAAVKRGVDVRLLLVGRPEKAWELIKSYMDAGVKMKYLPLLYDNFTMLVVDGTECKITLKDRTLPDKYNIFVHDVSLANVLQSYFTDCWAKANVLQPEKYLCNKKGNK